MAEQNIKTRGERIAALAQRLCAMQGEQRQCAEAFLEQLTERGDACAAKPGTQPAHGSDASENF